MNAESDKKTHFGRAGEFFAMSELLLRGWNVAVPVVDVGDDVFIIDDNDKKTRRLQVKTALAAQKNAGASIRYEAGFQLSRRQLREAQPIELYFFFLVRAESVWRFLVVPRIELLQIREDFVRAPRTGRVGAPPVADRDAKTDALAFNVVVEGITARGWDSDLSRFLDQWPVEIPRVTGGPGSSGPVDAIESEAVLARSQDPET